MRSKEMRVPRRGIGSTKKRRKKPEFSGYGAVKKKRRAMKQLQHDVSPPASDNWGSKVTNAATAMSKKSGASQIMDTTLAAMNVYQQSKNTYSKYATSFL
jgi:hypothetical protein